MRVQGQRPGDHRVRVARPRAETVWLPPVRRRRAAPPPALVLTLSFLVLIATGTILLILPISSVDGTWTPPLSALFTATSAACVTGLVVLDTASQWSGFGQLVILALIQLGGFGIMAGSTLLLLLISGRQPGLRGRVLAQETTGSAQLGGVVAVIRRMAWFVAAVELGGAVVLTVAFAWRGAVDDPVSAGWWGLFHAVSAFNNAGFDLVGGFQSLAPFHDDWLVLGTIGVLIVVGGLGFAIVADAGTHRRWSRWALETKIVLGTTLALLLGGTLVIGALEWSNPDTLGRYDPLVRPLNAAFESVTLRTAGFSVLPTGSLLDPTLFVVMALMFIGGASGSTAGGIKVNTFGLLLLVILSTIRGRTMPVAFGRRISSELVYRAIAIALLGVAFAFGAGFLVSLTTSAPFVEALFEAISAIGTVGASTGITPTLEAPAQLVVIVAMFAGRLGPLTLVLALAARARPLPYRPAAESIRIG
ncbi:MAG: Trk family potassium uptake protein [Chloroflexi bacterium]|nr:Trk family potassium uptake protein [Chloroflexota bacterium]